VQALRPGRRLARWGSNHLQVLPVAAVELAHLPPCASETANTHAVLQNVTSHHVASAQNLPRKRLAGRLQRQSRCNYYRNRFAYRQSGRRGQREEGARGWGVGGWGATHRVEGVQEEFEGCC
jgi:hypothetical protein